MNFLDTGINLELTPHPRHGKVKLRLLANPKIRAEEVRHSYSEMVGLSRTSWDPF